MSNANINQTARSEFDAPSGGGAACQAGDLKSLLNAIVNQISEADRRHSDTLHQMQDRLSNLGTHARSLRARVPDQFQTAFERIEAGMAELAARIAEAQGQPASSFMAAQPSHDFASMRAPMPAEGYEPLFAAAPASAAATPATPDSLGDEAPMALRSARSAPQPAARGQKSAPAVDTFDVIESLPGDVSDPWDRDAANALASVYESEPRSFAQDPYAAQIGDTPRAFAPAPAAAPASSIDQGWLEKRFSEISERIEASLAEIRPDQSFFAIGQRLDQFERSVSQAFDNVATRNDVEAVRLIEAHMVELVGHMESTSNHIARIEVIEDQLAAIAHRLNEVHEMASAAGDIAPADPAPQMPHVDVAAVARAAAHEAANEAAARFASVPQAPAHVPGIDDLRRLMEESINNSRQNEENTTALLDTLQQAMIRLLDRMDAIEINQHQAPAPAPVMHVAPSAIHRGSGPAIHEYEPAPRGPEPQLPYPQRDVANEALDEAVAAVASKAPGAPARPVAQQDAAEAPRRDVRNAPQPVEQRSSEKLRQDFIADARRAKMRLSGDDGDAIVLPAPTIKEAAAAPTPRAAAPKGKPAAVSAPAAEKSASALSPRVVALSVALALAGAAYVMLPLNKRTATPAAPVAAAQQQSTAAPAAEARVTEQNQRPDAAATANATADAPPPEADFSKPAASAPAQQPAQFNLYRTQGEIVPEDSPIVASRPLHGIAVGMPSNTETSMEQAARAQRDQTMANVSSKLGEIAAEHPAVVSPTALDLASQQGLQGPAVTAPRSDASALDMPPATVGPLSLRLAAANGDPSAQFEVGARLAEGKGTDQNFKDAAKWYQRAASQGFAQAQYRLGTLYERGLGLKADEARAKDWYQRAAEQGNMKAMHNLAVLSANAKSGTPDYATAAKWFADAAERGLADSQFNLAVLYENGLGVDADMRQAYKWVSLAARGGDKEAVRRRDLMKGKLSAADLAEAETLVRNFHMRSSDMLVNDARTAGEAWKKNPANGDNG